MRGGKTKFHKFHGLIFPIFAIRVQKIATNQTIFAEKSFVGDVWKLTWKRWFEAILGFLIVK